MKTTNSPQCRRSEKTSLSGKPVTIRGIGKREHRRFDKLLGKYHYLGEHRPVGDAMRMVAEIEGEWVGLLMWGSAAYRLKDRDAFILKTAVELNRPDTCSPTFVTTLSRLRFIDLLRPWRRTTYGASESFKRIRWKGGEHSMNSGGKGKKTRVHRVRPVGGRRVRRCISMRGERGNYPLLKSSDSSVIARMANSLVSDIPSFFMISAR